MSNRKDNHDTVDLLKFFMNYYGRYHDHKETMAWVATALYVVGIVYLASYLRSLIDGGCGWKGGGSGLVVAACFVALCFVYWQFKKRWTAHVIVYFILEELKREGKRCITVHQILESKDKDRRGWSQYRKACKYLLPCRWGEPRGYFEPIRSEVITYLAIGLATLAALGLVLSA